MQLPTFPSLISLMVSVDVKHHVYLLATYHSLGLPGFQLFVSSADIKSSAKGTSCGDKWSYIVSVWDRHLLVVSEINKPMFDYK